MTVNTPQEFFENVLPQRFDPNKAENINCVVQMNLHGDDGGAWNLTIRDLKIEIEEGVHASPSMTITMKATDYVDLVNGRLSGELAFLTGKLKFEGDLPTAMKLRNLGII